MGAIPTGGHRNLLFARAQALKYLCQKRFGGKKNLSTRAPTLGLPNPAELFQISTYKKGGVALEILTQRLGETQKPVAYLSKQ